MGNSQAVRILIVDDEVSLRETLQGQLETLPVGPSSFPGNPSGGLADVRIDIHHAVDGKQALEKIESMWFDTILTDVDMPEMTGIELLAALRAKGSDVPVVVLTGFGDKGKALEALRLGCYAYLDKPWNADYLRRVMTGGIEQGLSLRKRCAEAGATSARPKTESLTVSIGRLWKSVFESEEPALRAPSFPVLAGSGKKKAI